MSYAPQLGRFIKKVQLKLIISLFFVDRFTKTMLKSAGLIHKYKFL